jgi:hypothetical protein
MGQPITDERREQLRAAGRKGGQTTAARYGSAHMSAIGKRGFLAVARMLGDNGTAVSFLQKRHGMAVKPRSTWKKDSEWNQ